MSLDLTKENARRVTAKVETKGICLALVPSIYSDVGVDGDVASC